MKTLAREVDKAELVRRLRALRVDSPRRWGQMSAQQMICHLCDSCRVMTGEVIASDATGPMARTVIKWMALYLPMRWPQGIATRPELDALRAGTRPGEFVTDVAALEALLEVISIRDVAFDGRRHPIFGALSQSTWLRWAYLHTDHHLRQFGA